MFFVPALRILRPCRQMPNGETEGSRQGAFANQMRRGLAAGIVHCGLDAPHCASRMVRLKNACRKEGCGVGRRRRGVMTESFKQELARDLGFSDKVEREGWGAITAKEAGNMVKRAIQLAEQSLGGPGNRRR